MEPRVGLARALSPLPAPAVFKGLHHCTRFPTVVGRFATPDAICHRTMSFRLNTVNPTCPGHFCEAQPHWKSGINHRLGYSGSDGHGMQYESELIQYLASRISKHSVAETMIEATHPIAKNEKKGSSQRLTQTDFRQGSPLQHA